MKQANALLSGTGTTIFTVMSALAVQHNAINLGQGFPDTEGPADIVRAAADALLDGRNQYPPLTGVPELREAVAAANARFYGLEIDPVAGVVVRVNAQAGQQIQANDALLVLEAMKMETNITSPVAGKVKAINAGVGDGVQVGQVLVEFE